MTLAQVFSCEFCEIFKNTVFYRTPPVATSGPEIRIFAFYRVLKQFASFSDPTPVTYQQMESAENLISLIFILLKHSQYLSLNHRHNLLFLLFKLQLSVMLPCCLYKILSQNTDQLKTHDVYT